MGPFMWVDEDAIKVGDNRRDGHFRASGHMFIPSLLFADADT